MREKKGDASGNRPGPIKFLLSPPSSREREKNATVARAFFRFPSRRDERLRNGNFALSSARKIAIEICGFYYFEESPRGEKGKNARARISRVFCWDRYRAGLRYAFAVRIPQSRKIISLHGNKGLLTLAFSPERWSIFNATASEENIARQLERRLRIYL